MVCFKFWKLDKIDKIVISLIFIVVTMFSIFNCFCFAAEDFITIPFSEEIQGQWIFNGLIQKNSGGSLYIYHIYPGIETMLIAPSSYLNYGFFSGGYYPQLGDESLSYANIGIGEHIVEVPENARYLVIGVDSTWGTDFSVSVENDGFSTSMLLLAGDVSFFKIWSVFQTAIPYILVVVLFVFGWWFFAHWVKELGKGREF